MASRKNNIDARELDRLRIAHVVFSDIVGYSLRFTDEQGPAILHLQSIVRGFPGFQTDGAEKAIRIPTGDGIAVVWFGEPTVPVEFARYLAIRVRDEATFALRIGLHTGPLSCVTGINGEINVAGAGINFAQRVMDCGDGGHILLSQSTAETLLQLRRWRNAVHDLGECEVKHGVKLRVYNLFTEEFGNSTVPKRLRKTSEGRTAKEMAPTPGSSHDPTLSTSPESNKKRAWPMVALMAAGGCVLAATITFHIWGHRTAPMPRHHSIVGAKHGSSTKFAVSAWPTPDPHADAAPVQGTFEGVDYSRHRVAVYSWRNGAWLLQGVDSIDSATGGWSVAARYGTRYAALLVGDSFSPMPRLVSLPEIGGEILDLQVN